MQEGDSPPPDPGLCGRTGCLGIGVSGGGWAVSGGAGSGGHPRKYSAISRNLWDVAAGKVPMAPALICLKEAASLLFSLECVTSVSEDTPTCPARGPSLA